ncbi:YmjE family protein [Kluyvera genomosp. 2]
MFTSPQGEGGCEHETALTDCMLSPPTPLLPLLNRFDFRSTRPQTPLRSGGNAHGN